MIDGRKARSLVASAGLIVWLLPAAWCAVLLGHLLPVLPAEQGTSLWRTAAWGRVPSLALLSLPLFWGSSAIMVRLVRRAVGRDLAESSHLVRWWALACPSIFAAFFAAGVVLLWMARPSPVIVTGSDRPEAEAARERAKQWGLRPEMTDEQILRTIGHDPTTLRAQYVQGPDGHMNVYSSDAAEIWITRSSFSGVLVMRVRPENRHEEWSLGKD